MNKCDSKGITCKAYDFFVAVGLGNICRTINLSTAEQPKYVIKGNGVATAGTCYVRQKTMVIADFFT